VGPAHAAEDAVVVLEPVRRAGGVFVKPAGIIPSLRPAMTSRAVNRIVSALTHARRARARSSMVRASGS
jgi:hypothetical protein